jgi:hypothetical protein
MRFQPLEAAPKIVKRIILSNTTAYAKLGAEETLPKSTGNCKPNVTPDSATGVGDNKPFP